jgi:putative Holliday junction resolvase
VDEASRAVEVTWVSTEEQRIILLDEEGEEHHFALVDVVEVEDKKYAVLLPLEGEDDTAVVFRVEGESLVTIEDEDEFERVLQALEELEEAEDLEGEDDETLEH